MREQWKYGKNSRDGKTLQHTKYLKHVCAFNFEAIVWGKAHTWSGVLKPLAI